MADKITSENINELEQQYSANLGRLERLCATVQGLIVGALQSESIQFVQVYSRVKELTSFKEKISRKSYTGLSDCTDLVGARIVLFLESDVSRAQEVMRTLFEEDKSNSIDHRKRDVNTVGYSSLHLVCRLGGKRSSFLEYRGITDICFEIQIRTALQHAWAEIEHKQNYKAKNALPPSLQRRLALVSGNLESIDREFSEIVNLASNYEQLVEKGISSVNKDEISQSALVGLYQFAITHFGLKKYSAPGLERAITTNLTEIMKACGFETVADARSLVQNADRSNLNVSFQHFRRVSCDRFFKLLLILKDVDTYLEVGPRFGIGHIEESVLDFYEATFPFLDIRRKINNSGIAVRVGKQA